MSLGFLTNTLADVVLIGGAISGIGMTIDKFVKKSTKKKITNWCEDKWLKLSYISTLPFISKMTNYRLYLCLLLSSAIFYALVMIAHLYYLYNYRSEIYAKNVQFPDVLQYPICLSAAPIVVAFAFAPMYRWIVRSKSGAIILLKAAGLWSLSQAPGFVFAYGVATNMWSAPNLPPLLMNPINLLFMVFGASFSLSLFFLLIIVIFVSFIYLAMLPILLTRFVLLWVSEYETGPVLGAAFLASGAAALAKVFL